jgi:hypothetical protein
VVKRTVKVPWPTVCLKLSLWHAKTTSEVQVNDFFPGIEIGDSILQIRKKMENGETKKKKRRNLLALFEKKIKSALRLLDSNPLLFMVPWA